MPSLAEILALTAGLNFERRFSLVQGDRTQQTASLPWAVGQNSPNGVLLIGVVEHEL